MFQIIGVVVVFAMVFGGFMLAGGHFDVIIKAAPMEFMMIFGAAVVVFAVLALFVPKRWEEWTNLILGLWLIASPWILAFQSYTVAAANMVVVGAVIVVFSGTALGQRHATSVVYR